MTYRGGAKTLTSSYNTYPCLEYAQKMPAEISLPIVALLQVGREKNFPQGISGCSVHTVARGGWRRVRKIKKLGFALSTRSELTHVMRYGVFLRRCHFEVGPSLWDRLGSSTRCCEMSPSFLGGVKGSNAMGFHEILQCHITPNATDFASNRPGEKKTVQGNKL